MAQYCTILCPADEPGRVLSAVEDLIGDRGTIAVEGDVSDWSAVTVEAEGASLTLNRLVFGESGDKFARMQAGMWSFFDRVETPHAAIKADVLEKVEQFALAIGVVAEPGFDEEAGHFDCLFGLTAELDAIIWNGNGVLDAEGSMILDADGESEVAA
jgi:hypothetical protein